MQRLLFLIVFLIFTAPAQAAGPAAPLAAAEATRIETDQKTGAIRFIVDGREVARFERDGLHVRGDVNYSGMTKDTGPDGYDRTTTAEPRH